MRSRMEVYAQLSSVINFHRLPDPTSRYELLKTIGEGTYGEVFSAKDKTTGLFILYVVRVKYIFMNLILVPCLKTCGLINLI